MARRRGNLSYRDLDDMFDSGDVMEALRMEKNMLDAEVDRQFALKAKKEVDENDFKQTI